MKITRTTPYSIEIGKNNLTLKIYGESFLRGSGSPDFIIDASSIKHWTHRTTQFNYKIEDDERNQIIDYVLAELGQKGWVIKVE